MIMMGRSSRSEEGGVRWWVVALVATVAALLLWQGGAVRDAVGGLLSATDPSAFAAVPRSVLIERLQSAETEVARTRYQAIVYQNLMEEFRALQAEAGQRPDEAYMTARVIARPPQTHYDTLLLAAGARDGVAVGDSVSAERVLLGTVTAVSDSTAVVTLLSSPGAERDALVGTPPAIVILTGLGGGSFEAAIPTSVVTDPGDGARDEATGLLVAVVGAVSHAPTDVAATVHLALPVALSSLFEVSITHGRP